MNDIAPEALPILESASGVAGPCVFITAGIHGDEVGGVALVHDLFKMLGEHPLKKGSIKAIPLGNPSGFSLQARNAVIKNEEGNLNRSFPGNEDDGALGHAAASIFSAVTSAKPSLVIDLHNGWQEVPYILIDPQDDAFSERARAESIELAKQSGFAIVEDEQDEKKEYLKTLSGSLLAQGIPSFTVELGESYVVNERDVKNGLAALWNILVHLGMAKPVPQARMNILYPSSKIREQVLGYNDTPKPKATGLVRFSVRAGDLVMPEQEIAKIYDAEGKELETIEAQVEGVMLSIAEQASTAKDVPIFLIGAFRK